MNLEAILDAFFPANCAGCGAGDGGLCERCVPVGELQRFALGELKVEALGTYDGSLRRAILAFKRGRRDVGLALARAFAQRASGKFLGDAILVPVPTTSVRCAERGFDQAVLLAREMSRLNGLGVLEILRQTAGDAQRGRSRSARLGARGRFRCTAPSLVDGARVVLLDDVATTGATLRDCAAVLSEAGARVAGAFVLARAP